MKETMFVAGIILAVLVACAAPWPAKWLKKKILHLRREKLQQKRAKAMLSESNPFFARRVCRWIEHPERDPDLTWAVQCGEYPDLLVYLKKAANQK